MNLRRSSTSALALFLTVALVGCGASKTPATQSGGNTPAPAPAPAASQTPAPAPKAPVQVTVGSLVSTASVAWFVADELKLGQKHGIDFKLKVFQSPDDKDAGFAANQYPISTMGVDGGARLRGEGVGVSYIFGLVSSTNRFIVHKDFPGKSIADLKGKKLGMSSKTGSMVAIYTQMAKEAGFDFLTDTQITQGPPPTLPQLLKDKKVDAIEVWDPAVSNLLASGDYKVLVNPAEWYQSKHGDNFAFIGVIARDEFLKAEPEAAKAFVAMTKEAAQWVKDNPQKAAEIIAKASKITDEKVIATLAKEMPPTLALKWDAETGKTMQPYLDWVAAAGQLRKNPGLELFKTEFAPRS